MAHFRYNSNENKGITLTLKAGDLGLFDGIPLKKINEAKTREVISQSPVVSQDTFVKDLIVANKCKNLFKISTKLRGYWCNNSAINYFSQCWN